MDKKYQIIALIGESGAGKDTMQRETCLAHPLMFHPIVSCTTRPRRDNETDGCDYHFITLEDFTKKLLHGQMLEAADFRDWFYGTPIDSLSTEKINIGVFNPAGIQTIVKDPRLNVLVVKLNCPDKERLIRALSREEYPDCAEICRRYFTDKEDFSALDLDYFIVESGAGTSSDLLNDNNTLLDEIESMWKQLDVDTAFETIVRWESTMTKKAESEKDKDNND